MTVENASKLLFPQQRPLMVQPAVAKVIGLNEAIILQQIHYWLIGNEERNMNYHEGSYWVFNSYTEWQKQFPFWSISTIRRAVYKLEDAGYVVAGNFNKKSYDDTKWYTLDYGKLDELATQLIEEGPSRNNRKSKRTPQRTERTDPGTQNEHHPVLNLNTTGTQNEQTNTIEYPETTPETKISADSLRSSHTRSEEQKPKTKSQVSKPKTPTRKEKEVPPSVDENEGMKKSPDTLVGVKEYKALSKDSKYLTKRDTGQEKRLDVNELVDATARKSRERRTVKAQRPRKLVRNANTIVAYFNEKYSETLAGKAPIVAGKDKKLMKDLITHYGYEEVQVTIDWMFRNWAQFRRECNLNGVPTVGILYGYQSYLQEKTMHLSGSPEQDAKTDDEGDEGVWGV